MSHFKGNVIARQIAGAIQRRQSRASFISRNVWLWAFLAWVVYPLAAVLSGFSEGFFIYGLMDGAPTIPRWLFTLAAVGAIEGMVYFMGRGAIDDLQAGVLSAPLAERVLFVCKAIAFLGFFTLSVWLSLRGAPLFQEWRIRSAEPVELRLTDESTAAAPFAEQRAEQLAIIESARSTTWRGRMTREAMASLQVAQSELSRIDAEISAGRRRIRESNSAIVAAYESDMLISAMRAWNFAGLGQAMVLLSLLMIGLYYEGVEREAGLEGKAGDGAQVQQLTLRAEGKHDTLVPHSPEDRRPIGFRTYPPADARPTVAPARVVADLPELDQVTRLNSYRTLMKNYRVYEGRTSRAAADAKARIERHLAYEQEQLARLGKRIELQEHPVRKYILVDLQPEIQL